MEGIGALLLVIAVWAGYCGLNSYRPIRMAEAVLAKPGNAAATLDGASKQVAANTATALTSSDTTGGSVNTTGFINPSVNAPVSSSVAAEQAYANQAGKQIFGNQWNATEMQDLIKLWNQESGWNPKAYNAGSGATGIPQSLPGNKMASAGSDWKTNPQTQINWGLNYIKQRYGTPSQAWAHEISNNWY